MLRDILLWSAVGVPAAAVLVAIAVAALASLGLHSANPDRFGMAVFLLVQTLTPIAIWVAAEHMWATLRERRVAKALLFPLIVALVGLATVALSGGFSWPEERLAGWLAIGAWLGFSWTLLGVRDAARRWGPNPR